MRSIVKTALIALVSCTSLALAGTQTPEPASGAKPTRSSSAKGFTDLYHVHFAKAAPGKAAQMEENLKQPSPDSTLPGHALVLRHQDGDAWDFVAIEHLGTKVTLDAARPQVPAAQRNLGDWHNDTYATGPSWDEFAKAVGMDASGKQKADGAVYVVSTYRAVAGQRDALQKFLSESPSGGDTSAGNVLLQHFEGSDWNFLSVTRYHSWQDFATNESNSVAETAKKQGGWFKLRELIARHTDTIAVKISP